MTAGAINLPNPFLYRFAGEPEAKAALDAVRKALLQGADPDRETHIYVDVIRIADGRAVSYCLPLRKGTPPMPNEDDALLAAALLMRTNDIQPPDKAFGDDVTAFEIAGAIYVLVRYAPPGVSGLVKLALQLAGLPVPSSPLDVVGTVLLTEIHMNVNFSSILHGLADAFTTAAAEYDAAAADGLVTDAEKVQVATDAAVSGVEKVFGASPLVSQIIDLVKGVVKVIMTIVAAQKAAAPKA
jgi:hypothetical protein